VAGVSPFVDPSTGTALAQLDVLEQSKKVKSLALAPGLQGQVLFRANPRQGYQIPDTAVIYKGQDSFIRIVQDKKIKFIPISLGKKQRGLFEVLKGPSPQMHLVERSSRFVAEGETVALENAEDL
jgi:HlyD family secretion protein